jgi:uncharacterized phage protein (TIGR02218 family)
VKTIPPLLLADLQKDATSLAFIWSIEMADGRMIRGTEHDLDITIPDTGDSPTDKYAGRYYAIANVTSGDIQSNSDLAVDNLEVQGAFPEVSQDSPYAQLYTPLDVTVDEIESGLLDKAPVTVMICNWRAPEHGYFVAKSGILGAINHDSDGKYTTEVRGLAQILAQTVIRTFSTSCNVVKFGDRRCKFPVATTIINGVVGAVTNRQEFAVTLDDSSPPNTFSYTGGELTFISGANTGFSREVKLDPRQAADVAQFWDQFPESVSPGDAFTLTGGCDRQRFTCKGNYDNLPNFRGFGVFIPGVNALTAGPTTVAELGSEL